MNELSKMKLSEDLEKGDLESFRVLSNAELSKVSGGVHSISPEGTGETKSICHGDGIDDGDGEEGGGGGGPIV